MITTQEKVSFSSCHIERVKEHLYPSDILCFDQTLQKYFLAGPDPVLKLYFINRLADSILQWQ